MQEDTGQTPQGVPAASGTSPSAREATATKASLHAGGSQHNDPNYSHPDASHPDGGRPARREIVTPQGTMVVVMIYALGTILLWSYLYYYTLRFGGVIGGH